ncbi:hypothetical protein M8J76_013134 [Diaphorina citri]|nr:hypothetical protein M8J76_013134 [Diaphorina citri]
MKSSTEKGVEQTEERYKREVETEYHIAQGQLNAILASVHKFCLLLQDIDSATVPAECPAVEKFDWLLCLLKTKLESVGLRAAKRQDVHPLLDDNLFRSDTGPDQSTAMWTLGQVDICPPPLVDTKNKNAQVEEDEVPTRAFLKRQAQVRKPSTGVKLTNDLAQVCLFA